LKAGQCATNDYVSRNPGVVVCSDVNVALETQGPTLIKVGDRPGCSMACALNPEGSGHRFSLD